MKFSERCSAELEKLVGGYWHDNSLYFTLEELKQLPGIIKRLNRMGDLVISPYHLSDSSVIEIYGCTLSIKSVKRVQDKFNVLLSEAGRDSLEKIENHYIEQWDYTYYEILKSDVKGVIESLSRYVTYMERREDSLRKQYNKADLVNPGIFYEIW